MSINVIGRRQKRRFFFIPLAVWSCFWFVPACPSLLWLLAAPLFTRDYVTKYSDLQSCSKSTSLFKNVASVITKCGASMYYKAGKVILQGRVGKKEKLLLQSGTTIKKWGNFYYNFSQGIPEKINFCQKNEKEELTPPLTCKLEMTHCREWLQFCSRFNSIYITLRSGYFSSNNLRI